MDNDSLAFFDNRYLLFFDGACEPINPGGTGGYGWLLTQGDIEIINGFGIIGSGPGMTNNVAEYQAIIEGIKAYIKYGHNGNLIIQGDSDLVCKMLGKVWGWNKKKTKWEPHKKQPHLKKLLEEALGLLENITYKVNWVPREENAKADELSKKALLEAGIIQKEEIITPCEKCGGKLIKRNGKYGEFMGCSNYPKCTFSKKI